MMPKQRVNRGWPHWPKQPMQYIPFVPVGCLIVGAVSGVVSGVHESPLHALAGGAMGAALGAVLLVIVLAPVVAAILASEGDERAWNSMRRFVLPLTIGLGALVAALPWQVMQWLR